jgi:uncharacterized protein YdhG (YjbR/CyaY superfamily)
MRRVRIMRSEEVDAYLAGLVPDRREALSDLRQIIRATAPGAKETMRYRMPTYEYEDRVLCSLASQKHYMSLYMEPVLVDQHRGELASLSVGKSCVRFRKLEDLPLETVRAILRETLANAEREQLERKEGARS